MSFDEERAARMYPTTPAAAPVQPVVAAPASAASSALAAEPKAINSDPAQAAAERMYPPSEPLKAETVPAAVAALRDTPERRMFDPERTYASTGIAALFEGQPNARAEAASWSNILADVEALSSEASTMVSLVRATRADPPSDEAVDAWGRDAMALVEQQHGARANDLLAAARRLVARDSRVSKFLLESGLGSHPRVVSMVIEKAASLRAAGRL
jgi:hypothetical protein